MEEVDFLYGFVGSNEKERTDMKLENVCIKQNSKHEARDVDMKLEKAGMELEINTLTFGLQCFAGSDDDIRFYTVFPSYSTQLVSMNFFNLCHSIELQGLR